MLYGTIFSARGFEASCPTRCNVFKSSDIRRAVAGREVHVSKNCSAFLFRVEMLDPDDDGTEFF